MALRITGILCLAGVSFLARQLVPSWIDLRQLPLSNGWLDLSGAAWPSRWLYAGAHAWLCVAAARSAPIAGATVDRFLFVALLVAVLTAHALVPFTPLRDYTMRPALW